MKLDWEEKGNMGSIKHLKQPIEISIHKYFGCGDALFLSCPTLRISQFNLNTEDWDTAEGKAIKAIESTISNLHADMIKLVRQYEVVDK